MRSSRDPIVALVLAVLLAVATAAVFLRDARPEYAGYQSRFRALVEGRAGREAADAVPSGVQQIWVSGAARADRCPTCHQAVAWRGFETASEPWRTHPARILESHPVDRFGCTLCHGGQGWATTKQAAHGRVEGWSEPLLDEALAGTAVEGLDRRGALEIGCNLCHRYETDTAGMPMLNRAKALVGEKGCRACHRINGRGGLIGPELTWAGDKHPEQYDYSRLDGRPSVFRWHVAHLRDPRALVPDSVMPNFHLQPADTAALAALVMSWRRVDMDLSLVGRTPRAEATPDGAQQPALAAMLAGPGAWFVRTGCQQCHDVSVFGVKGATPIGPDLSTAADDAERRYSRPIEAFIAAPVGTMQAVFARQLILTPEQRAEAVRQLRAAYAAFQKRQAAK